MAALDHIHVKLSVDAADAADFVSALTAENERNARLLAEARAELAALRKINSELGDELYDLRRGPRVVADPPKPADPRSAALARAVAADRPLDGWAR